jgi:hypothetical protein
MTSPSLPRWLGLVSVLSCLFVSPGPGFAQTFSSGSTGALGAFSPSSNTAVTLPADGILNYTTVTIPSGVTVTFIKNAANTPVTMLATGDVSISGTISVNGSLSAACSGPTVAPGGASGPGGFNGGRGGAKGSVNNQGSIGQGPGGGALVGHGTYGAQTTFVTLIPLFGGSGGSGLDGSSSACGYGGSGGGGAIVVASTTKITVSGSITANGGAQPPACPTGAAGSGGAMRLVSPYITIPGTVEAKSVPDPSSPGCYGGSGRIRLEAFSYGVLPGTTNPTASIAYSPGAVTPGSTLALVNLPTVTITSVAGLAPPATPTGSYTVADITLPGGTSNPVSVTVTATNTPVGTVFQLRVLPPAGAASTVNSTASTGTFASSTATANVTLPNALTSVLNVYGSYTLTP